jgi:nitroreductase
MKAMDMLNAILEHASYRGKYLATPVPRAHMQTILEAGLAAPSGCNKQTTSLIAVDDPALAKRLYKAIAPCDPNEKQPVGATSPAMVCVLTRRIVAYEDRSYFIQDYAAAIQNMLLTIVALGYQSCWVEGYVTGADRLGRMMADLLGAPPEYELICYLPVGVAAEPVRRVRKKTFAERAWFNGFGLA